MWEHRRPAGNVNVMKDLPRFMRMPIVNVVLNGGEKDRGVLRIPSPGPIELHGLMRVLQEIVESHHNDLHETDPPTKLPEIAEKYDEMEGFRWRCVWRFGSYTLFLCNADKLASRVLKRTNHSREHWCRAGPVSPPVPEVTAFSGVKLWRDKCFAHTAFADPRTPENFSDHMTSLAMLTGNGSSRADNGDLRFGGFEVRMGGTPTNFKFRSMTVPELHEIGVAHMSAWYSAIALAVNPLLDLTLEEARTIDSRVVHWEPRHPGGWDCKLA